MTQMSRRGNRAGFSGSVLLAVLAVVLAVVCLVSIAGIIVYNTSRRGEESASAFKYHREIGVRQGAEEVLSNGVGRLYKPTGPDRGETLASGITIAIGDQGGGVPLYTLENVKFLKRDGGTSLFGSFSGGIAAGSGSVLSRWSGLFHGTVDQEGNLTLILIGMAREGQPHQECEGRECNGDVEVWSGKIHPDAVINGAHLALAEAKENEPLADTIRYFALGTIRYNVRLVQEQSRRKESSESNK